MLSKSGGSPDASVRPSPFSYLWALYSMELRRLFAYRTDFWVRFVGVVLAHVTLAYCLWQSIFTAQGVDRIEGFSLSGMMLYYVLVPLIEGVSRCGDPGQIAAEIYEGGLTRYLIYPIPYFPVEYIRSLAAATLAAAQLGLVLTVWAMVAPFPSDAPLSLATVVAGILTAVLMSLLHYALKFCLELVAFWVDNVWNLGVMMMFVVRLLGGGLLPLALFPEGLRSVLSWTPFPYLLSFPVRTTMGMVALREWCFAMSVALFWTVTLALVGTLLWRRGRRQYAGVGI